MLNIVGLYLNPPENALVLSVDEETQIQALDRTQPELPSRNGNPKRLIRKKQAKKNCLNSKFIVDEESKEVLTSCSREIRARGQKQVLKISQL